jgi:hypothetical protein
MSPLQQFWHVMNFLTPALATAAIAAALAKLLWRRELAGRPWILLALWAALAGEAAMIGGWILLGRDGALGSYAAMVVAIGLALWAGGFVARSGNAH